MKKYYYIPMLALYITPFLSTADPIICFFFKSMPDTSSVTKNLKKPGKLAKHTLSGIAQHIPIAGIYVTYSGYITISDALGEVRFPRKHKDNNATVIITPEIEPVTLADHTVLNWKSIPHKPVEVYSLQEIYDPTTKNYFWSSEKISMPSNNTIPSSALVILAKPKNIFIPSEKTKTVKTANLMLPPIYVKKGINIVSQGINTLVTRHLFRPVDYKKQQTSTRISSHLLN